MRKQSHNKLAGCVTRGISCIDAPCSPAPPPPSYPLTGSARRLLRSCLMTRTTVTLTHNS